MTENKLNEELLVIDASYDEKRKKIIDYAKTKDVVDALEIAESLHFDVFEVNEIFSDLINEGILQELS